MKRRLALAASLLCLGACAAGPAAAQEVRPPAASPPAPAEVARYAADLMARNYRADAPGAAVLVARGDKVLFRGARGEADVDRDLPLRPGSVFRIASVTKQFSAAGLLTLVEAGRVKLDDPLSKYLPDYPGGERITVLQLLNHTAGVRDYTAIPGYVETRLDRHATTAEMIDAFKGQTPEFEPGTRWAYSNSNYVLVGAIIEAVTGRPWWAYIEQALFRPLGMRHTGYGHDPRFAARQVRGYSYRDGRVVAPQPISITQPHAAGALVSNVDDLLKWTRALHEGRVLKTAAYRRMITPEGRAADAGYGFGLYREKVRGFDALRHGGAIFGFSATLSYLPGPDVTVVVLENDDATNSPETARTLARRLAAAAVGDPYPAPRLVAVDPAALRAAEGVYRFPGDVWRTLRVVEGKLTAQRVGREPLALTPVATDDFLYDDGFTRLKLVRDGQGAVTGARWFADGEGAGELGVRTNEAPPSGPVAVALPRAALERVVGTYANGRRVLKVYLEGEVLKVRLGDQDPLDLRATSATGFAVDQTGAALEFSAGDAPAARVVIKQGGRELVFDRAP